MANIKHTNQQQNRIRSATIDPTGLSLKEIKKETIYVARDFTHFLTRSNAMDIASAMVLSTSIISIVNSIVNDLLMPCIGAIFSTNIKTLVLTVGTAQIAYGAFIQAVFNFLLIAWVFFLVLRTVSTMRQKIEAIENKADE